MTVSEVIKALQSIEEMFGNLPLRFYCAEDRHDPALVMRLTSHWSMSQTLGDEIITDEGDGVCILWTIKE